MEQCAYSAMERAMSVEPPATPAEVDAPPAVSVLECDTLIAAVDPGLHNIGLYAAAAALDLRPLPEETPLDVALIDGVTEDGMVFVVCDKARQICAAVRPRRALILYEEQTVAAGGARIGGHNPQRCGRIVAALELAIQMSGVPAESIETRGMRLTSPRGIDRKTLKGLRRGAVREKRPGVWAMIEKAYPKSVDQDHMCDAVCLVMQDLKRQRDAHAAAERAAAKAVAPKSVRGRDTARPPRQTKPKITIL